MREYYFPNLCSRSQFDRRVRALERAHLALQRASAEEIAEPSAVYHVLDTTTLVAAMVRVRASRRGLFAGQASFGRSASKTEWVYGLKVALVVDPRGVVNAFGLAPTACDERPIGDALLLAEDRRHGGYLGRQGLLRGRSGETKLVGALRGRGGCHPEEQRAPGMGRRPIADGRRASVRSSRG